MLDPEALVSFEADVDADIEADVDADVGERPVLVQALDGFVDAGNARRLARAHLLATGDPAVVARFDADQIVDHRARRPRMVFAVDHWESYGGLAIVVSRLRDASGTPYLLLDGPEPDYQWERFAAAVRLVVERLRVRLVVGLGAIPMAVPHTRPLGLITSATRPELLRETNRWIESVQVPAMVGNMLEFRLGAAGHDAMGLVAQVPHYLASAEYAPAAVALLEALADVAALDLPLDALREAAAQTLSAVEEQVAGMPDVAEVVRALEGQYDAFVNGQRRSLLADRATLPTAEELGAEFERFLAEQAGREGDQH